MVSTEEGSVWEMSLDVSIHQVKSEILILRKKEEISIFRVKGKPDPSRNHTVQKIFPGIVVFSAARQGLWPLHHFRRVQSGQCSLPFRFKGHLY